MKPWQSLLFVSTTAFGIGLANGGSASAAEEPDATAYTPPTLQEVIVTAEKQPQPLQDAALAVTALTHSQLGNLGATDFSDYYRLVPGLQAIDRGPGQKKYVLRGLNSESAPNLAPLVQQYLDDFPMTLVSGAQPDLRLYDLARVEVLRGPQGTLYGSGSMGGTIRYITNQPDLDSFGGEAVLTGSDTQGGSGNVLGHLVLNVPLVPGQAAARAVGYGEHDSGFIDNVITGQKETNSTDVQGGRVAVRWRPTSRLDMNLMVLDQHLTAQDLQIDTAGFAVPPSPFPPFVPWFPTGAHAGDYQVVKSRSEPTTDDMFISNFSGTYDFDWAKLSSATTYYDHKTKILQETPELLGYGSYDLTDTGDRTFSEELRLAHQSGALRWLVGGFYLHNAENPGGTNQTAIMPNGALYFIQGMNDLVEQKAAFGEVSYDVLPNLSATVGLRTARYDESQTSVPIVAPPAPPGAPRPLNGPFGVSQGTTTEKYELSYHFSADSLAYVLASSGFRPGGFNSIAFNPAINSGGEIPRSYQSDSLWNYELGWKRSLLDRRMTFDSAVYYIDWSSIQVTEFNPTGAYSYEGNASRAAIYGAETEINWLVTRGLELALNGAYNDAELARNEPGAGGPVPPHATYPGLAGDRLPDVPIFSGSFVANYEFPLNASGLNGFVNGSVTYTGKSATTFRPNDPLYRVLPSYTLLNLRLGAKEAGWHYTAFIDNLTNRRTIAFIDPRAGYNRNYVERPRTFGATIEKDF